MSDSEFNKIFSKNLNKLLNSRNKTQIDLAEYVGVSTAAVSSWCTGKKLPRMNKVDQICTFLGVNRSDLMEEKADPVQNNFNYFLEKQEIAFIEKYRSIDDDGRNAVNYILDHEAKRAAAAQALQEATAAYAENIIVLPTLVQRICAGTGSIGDDVLYEEGQYPAFKVPEGSQFAAAITGSSMEPDFSDGDIVFCKPVDTLKAGDIGIFNINDENVIKKYTENGLEALNPDYDTLVPVDDDHVSVIGLVLGKL